MSTRDETEMALDGFHAAIVDVCKSQWADNTKKFARVDDARARLLALLAPEPRKRVMVGGSDHTTVVDANLVPLSPAPEPQPSDAEIEAGARFIDGVQFSDQAWEAMPVGYKHTMRHRAKAVLAAARAARQTGGEG